MFWLGLALLVVGRRLLLLAAEDLLQGLIKGAADADLAAERHQYALQDRVRLLPATGGDLDVHRLDVHQPPGDRAGSAGCRI